MAQLVSSVPSTGFFPTTLPAATICELKETMYYGHENIIAPSASVAGAAAFVAIACFFLYLACFCLTHLYYERKLKKKETTSPDLVEGDSKKAWLKRKCNCINNFQEAANLQLHDAYKDCSLCQDKKALEEMEQKTIPMTQWCCFRFLTFLTEILVCLAIALAVLTIIHGDDLELQSALPTPLNRRVVSTSEYLVTKYMPVALIVFHSDCIRMNGSSAHGVISGKKDDIPQASLHTACYKITSLDICKDQQDKLTKPYLNVLFGTLSNEELNLLSTKMEFEIPTASVNAANHTYELEIILQTWVYKPQAKPENCKYSSGDATISAVYNTLFNIIGGYKDYYDNKMRRKSNYDGLPSEYLCPEVVEDYIFSSSGIFYRFSPKPSSTDSSYSAEYNFLYKMSLQRSAIARYIGFSSELFYHLAFGSDPADVYQTEDPQLDPGTIKVNIRFKYFGGRTFYHVTVYSLEAMVAFVVSVTFGLKPFANLLMKKVRYSLIIMLHYFNFCNIKSKKSKGDVATLM